MVAVKGEGIFHFTASRLSTSVSCYCREALGIVVVLLFEGKLLANVLQYWDYTQLEHRASVQWGSSHYPRLL